MSATSFLIHPEALEEAASAARWYLGRSSIAASRFLSELDRVLDEILEAPQRWPVSTRGVRKVKLPCFPYLVIYREQSGTVLILAVAHGRRRPGYWRNRL